ncbi:hypothetical protein QFC24_003437 [Naganishia onofrii]|uniref:Uncharacterized protein n=1 Tax=Naganishia onofrii TaxID=1851511 RepID=A0ACC2XJ53_9TREE|nr:hypothetical protein QFC24_003437 [Naganishia onofrii]
MAKVPSHPGFEFKVDPELNIDTSNDLNWAYRHLVNENAHFAQGQLKKSETQVGRQMGNRLEVLLNALANQYNGTEAVLKEYRHVLDLDTKAARYHPIGEAEWWWEDAEIQDIVVEYILKPISPQGDTAIRRAREEEEAQSEYRRLGDDGEVAGTGSFFGSSQ